MKRLGLRDDTRRQPFGPLTLLRQRLPALFTLLIVIQRHTRLLSVVSSALDASASLLNALAVRYALRPPDTNHRFGHGKPEAHGHAAR